MFTGIIEHIVQVKKVSTKTGGAELFLDLKGFYDNLVLGESIAINGVCLTVKEINGNLAGFDVSGETLKKSTIGMLRNTDCVNIERALRVGDRLGGHFVTGHIDGVGIIREKRQLTDQCTMTFAVDKTFTDMMIEKGSVAIDGTSLTNVDVENGIFSVALIPFTLASTTLGFKKNGDKVNIEIDMMGKWIKKLLTGNSKGKKSDITQERLRELGF